MSALGALAKLLRAGFASRRQHSFPMRDDLKLPNLIGAHDCGMAFVVVKNEPLNPFNVRLFGAQRIMLEPDSFPYLVEEFRLVRLRGWR